MSRSWGVVWLGVIVVWSACGLTACGYEGSSHPEPAEAYAELDDTQPEVVVARVDGRPLSGRELELYWQEHPELSRQQAVEALVERQLLAAEARRRGFDSDPELTLARKRAMGRRLLDVEIEEEVTGEGIDDEQLESTSRLLAKKRRRPRGVRASHILVGFPKPIRKKAGKKSPPAPVKRWSEKLEPWIADVREALPDQPHTADLFDVQRQFEERVPEGASVIVNANLLFPAADARSYEGELPRGWNRVVKPFGEAATELLADRGPGALTEPVRTRFGWHLILVHEALPGAEPDAESIAALARHKLISKQRFERFKGLYNPLLHGSEVETYPEVLDEKEQLH